MNWWYVRLFGHHGLDYFGRFTDLHSATQAARRWLLDDYEQNGKGFGTISLKVCGANEYAVYMDAVPHGTIEGF